MKKTISFSLILLAFLGCGHTKTPVLNSVYKKKLSFEVDGTGYRGTAVLDERDHYDLRVFSSEDSGLVQLKSCHLDQSIQDPDDEQDIIYKRSEIERDNSPCPLHIVSFDKESRHSFGMISFRSPEIENLSADLICNGRQYASDGVSLCDARVGTIQGILFLDEVEHYPSAICDQIEGDGHYFEVKASKGLCMYIFKSKDDRVHRMMIHGYDDQLYAEDF